MVDVTDAAFRSLARAHGADVTCSEMVAATGVNHDNARAWSHLEPWPASDGRTERPYGVQFMTGDPAEMREAVLRVGHAMGDRIDFVDLNLGCPAPNILRSCAGGFLMRDPEEARKVIRAGRAAADEAGIRHVTVKMRLGPDERRLTYLEVGQAAQEEGVSWATLHARTVAQGYSGQAEWHHIAALVDHLDIPVVGNGDLRTPQDVVQMREATGCAGFFVARAAMHDPTVFARMRAALEGQGVAPPPDAAARRAVLRDYLARAAQAGITHVPDLRRQATRFVAGTPGAARLRGAMQAAATLQDLVQLVEQGAP